MFDEEIYTRDPISVLEERKLLQQIISLGVGYPYGKSWGSNAAILNMDKLHWYVSRLTSLNRYFDTGSITQEAKNHIRNGDEGYYLVDLYCGHILFKGKHPIEDVIIDFTLSDTDDRVQLRRGKGTRLHNMDFLISPNSVFFLGGNGAYLPLNEFHMISFIGSDDNIKSGFVVDYDAAQSKRPLVFFPCEENNDIIQAQLDQDDQCLKEECESFLRDIGYDW